MLRVDIHAVPQVATLRCIGRLVLGMEAEMLRCMAEARNEACLMLDLSEIRAMDAAGLGLLVELHCRARSRGRVLRIVKTSPCVRRLIALVNLQPVFGLADVEEIELGNESRSPLVRRQMSA